MILVIDSDNHLKDDLNIFKSNSTVYLNNVSDKDGKYWVEFIDSTGSSTIQSSSTLSKQIPTWIKNNADWWASGQISDDDFIKGIQYLVSNKIIKV